MAQHTTAELAIGSDFAGYRVEEVAARGGMGVVYRATQLRLGRTVALKLVTPALARDESFRARFRREWMIAASIDHPNVIPVYEAGEEGDALFIAMRWVEGTDLRVLVDSGALDPARAVHLVSQLAGALDAAHERDLIHRDVKPANVLIAGHDHVYLTDFGLTKHASSISGLTRTGQWVGTVDYTAPEQIEGATVCKQTDVYSLGCLLFETLTGEPPYRRENELATLWAHVYKPPPSVREINPELPAGFDDVIQRALAKDPADRYESAGELARAAAAVRGSETRVSPAPTVAAAAAPPAAPSAEGKRGRPNPRWLVLAGAGVALLIAAIAAILISSGSDDPGTESAATSASTPALRTGSTWRSLPPMPTARQNMPSAVLDGTIWVPGGLEPGAKGSRKVEGYDPAINAWKAGPALPVALHHEMAVPYKDQLVVIGGWIPKGDNPSGEVSDRVFALRGGSWVELPSLNRARAAGAAAVVGDRIVVVGGQADDHLVPTTEVFDGKRWTTAADIPTPREHLAAASDGRFVYAVGGRDLSPDENSSALERFDPQSGDWERLPGMSTPRGGLGATFAGGRIFAIGGETATDVMGKVESYDIGAQSWSSGPTMRTPRHGITATAIGPTVYALGGATRPGHATAAPTAEALRLVSRRPAPAASTWRSLPPMPTARQNMPSAVLDGTIWVPGGLEPGAKGSRKVEGYDPAINAWKAGPALPVALHHEMAVPYKDQLVVIGGWIPKGDNPSGEVSDRVFALRGGSWVELPSLNRARAAGAAAVVGDRIVVVGGQADDHLVPTTEVFDGKRWTTAADIPTPREHLAAASDGRFVYAVGGRDLSPDENSSALERFDPQSGDWERLPGMSTPRGGLGATFAGGRIFAIGGETATDVMGKVESYDIGAQSWSSGPTMRTPRHGITATAIGPTVYALGGATRPGHATAAPTAEALRAGR